MCLMDFSLGDVGSLFTGVREAITGKKILDPNEQAKIELQLAQLENALQTGQIEINKAEANNPSWFVAGARPFILWVCGFAIAYQFVVYPLAYGFLGSMDITFPIPELNVGMLFNLMISMLGMSGLRTYEKLKGIDTKKISNIEPVKEEKY